MVCLGGAAHLAEFAPCVLLLVLVPAVLAGIQMSLRGLGVDKEESLGANTVGEEEGWG